jgi:hypothetical protein
VEDGSDRRKFRDQEAFIKMWEEGDLHLWSDRRKPVQNHLREIVKKLNKQMFPLGLSKKIEQSRESNIIQMCQEGKITDK